MNFSDFSKKEIKAEKKDREQIEKDIKASYDELKDLNEDELSKRLYDEVRRQKQDGSFNYDMLESSVESIKHLIPNENYQNLKRILKTLK